jgi:glycerate dehydrogenase
MKAVFLDFSTLGPGLDVSGLQDIFPDLEVFAVTDAKEVAERIHVAEFVLTNKVRLTGEILQGSPNLKFIGLTATGTDNVDLVFAKQNNIAVCNIRAYCTESIAEHVFGCLLNLTHSLVQYNASVRRGEWQESANFCLLGYPIRELSAMTLGIVGYGDLGKGVANVARAFGMEVIISARPGADTVDDGRVAFEDVLRLSDVISLHCPLTEDNAGLFGEAEFEKMKSDAILINTARGGLVDSAALVSALRNGDIAAAAVDVLPQEPPVEGNPLLDYDAPNLLITPHVAWGSNEARQAAVDQLTATVVAFLEGEQLNRVV